MVWGDRLEPRLEGFLDDSGCHQPSAYSGAASDVIPIRQLLGRANDRKLAAQVVAYGCGFRGSQAAGPGGRRLSVGAIPVPKSARTSVAACGGTYYPVVAPSLIGYPVAGRIEVILTAILTRVKRA